MHVLCFIISFRLCKSHLRALRWSGVWCLRPTQQQQQQWWMNCRRPGRDLRKATGTKLSLTPPSLRPHSHWGVKDQPRLAQWRVRYKLVHVCFTAQISSMAQVESYVLKVLDDNKACQVFLGELRCCLCTHEVGWGMFRESGSIKNTTFHFLFTYLFVKIPKISEAELGGNVYKIVHKISRVSHLMSWWKHTVKNVSVSASYSFKEELGKADTKYTGCVIQSVWDISNFVAP